MIEKKYCKDCKWFNNYDHSCIVGNSKDSYFTESFIDHKGEERCRWKNKKEFFSECKKHKIKENYILFDFSIPCCNFNEYFNCKYYEKKKWWKK